MKASAICLTHGRRPEILAEAIECFRLLEVPTGWEKELILLNDQPSQTLVCRVPGVRTINMRTVLGLGDKHRIAVDIADGDFIMPWDDDDIYLPHRLTVSARYLSDWGFHTSFAWYSDSGPYRRSSNMHHCASFLSRELAARYSTGDHADTDARLFRSCPEIKATPVSDEEIYYIYRWADTGDMHGSAISPTEFRAKVAADIAQGKRPSGTIEIQPRWSRNWNHIERVPSCT
jgi:hypothetical protein